MIKRIKEHGYLFKNPFGDIVVAEVEVGLTEGGRRSLSAAEIDRLTRMAGAEFVKSIYRQAITDPDFSISARVVRAIMACLRVNQEEFGNLVGCQKSKVSKILRSEQKMSKSQDLLSEERLCQELARPGAIRNMLGDVESKVSDPDPKKVQEINEARYIISGAA
jgi:hypothetical protein